ncbi:two pore domain potassium channel family protein [Lysinibacillus xylanilyticus]|uniref:two pore domain potassium channel family protein n=1 Tax=Lysinibacillus xylanilyticus TaxID=582475 RepID=UPI001E5A0346|nr:two pore domain potassium channel family protein [Lysinibacillus xylanilyticus]
MLSFILSAKRLLVGMWKSFKRPQFLSLFTTLFFIILSGTMFYKGTEGWYWIDAMYFAVVSLIPTGVETGLYPTSNFSKIFTMIYLTSFSKFPTSIISEMNARLSYFSVGVQTSAEIS